MPSRFVAFSREEFTRRVDQYNWKRRISAIDVHHTYRPNHGQWQGEKSMNGMYHYHVVQNGWSDIAQHLTIAPDGLLWPGRDWNAAPASSPGINGSSRAGPFMFEMVGDFDKGRDVLDGEQLRSVLHVISTLMDKWDLSTKAIRFHREYRDKTCPGSAIVKSEFLRMVQDYHEVNSVA